LLNFLSNNEPINAQILKLHLRLNILVPIQLILIRIPVINHPIIDGPKGEDITLSTILLPKPDLGRSRTLRPYIVSHNLRLKVQGLREPKVSYLEDTVINEDIARLYIPVRNVAPVQVLEAIEQLSQVVMYGLNGVYLGVLLGLFKCLSGLSLSQPLHVADYVPVIAELQNQVDSLLFPNQVLDLYYVRVVLEFH